MAQKLGHEPFTPSAELSSVPPVVREMVPEDAPAWDRFVLGAENGTFFHRAGWRQIFAEVFHLRPRFLLATHDGQISGVLPMVEQRSFIFGNALVAAPFCVEGGPLTIDEPSRSALDAAAAALMAATKASYVEYRSRTATRSGWTARSGLYATFSRPISALDNENLLAIPRKQRAVVRKTLTSPLTSEVSNDTDEFFRIYAESVRNLGTPVFPKRYFSALKRVFGHDCDIVLVRDPEGPLSAVMNFYFKDMVLPYYGGGTRRARQNGANDFMYWEVIRRAAQRGFRHFDFGRSKAGTGAFAFKKNWGFEPRWLEYEYKLRSGTALPEKNPSNPKYALFIELWKRLPLALANTVGPYLIRHLG